MNKAVAVAALLGFISAEDLKLLGQDESTYAPKMLGEDEQTWAPKMLGEDEQTWAPKMLGEDEQTWAPKMLGEDEETWAPKMLGEDEATWSPKMLGEDENTWAPREHMLGEDRATWTPEEFLPKPPMLGEDEATWSPQRPLVTSTPEVRFMQVGDMSVADVDQYLDGLIFGLLHKEDLVEIVQCLKDATGVKNAIIDAFNKIEEKSISSVVNAISEIGGIVENLPKTLGGCTAMQGDLDKLTNWAQIFSDPWKLVPMVTGNVIKNFNSILNEASQMQASYNTGDFHSLGMQTAAILVWTIGPIQASAPPMQEPEKLSITQW